jgi:hypothetical protein
VVVATFSGNGATFILVGSATLSGNATYTGNGGTMIFLKL